MVRVGLIGCGGIGKHHAARLVGVPDVSLVAVCDIIPARADKVAGRYGAKPFYSYAEMMDEVDVAWICTPPHTHRDISVDCLRAGKDVFCEKPMALSLADCDDMIAAAKAADRLLAIGYCLRFWDWTLKCKEIVDSGALGEITSVWITRMSPIPDTPWIPSESLSGGMLTEQTTHNLDWMRVVAGDVDSLFAYGQTVTPGADILDNVSAVLHFKSGAQGQAMASWSSAADWIESGIVGTKGVLRTGQGGDIRLRLCGQDEQVISPADNDMYADEEIFFMERVKDRKPYLFDLEEAKQSLAISLAIHESARTGREVRL